MPRLFLDILFLRSMVDSVFGARDIFGNSGTFDILSNVRNTINNIMQERLRNQLQEALKDKTYLRSQRSLSKEYSNWSRAAQYNLALNIAFFGIHMLLFLWPCFAK